MTSAPSEAGPLTGGESLFADNASNSQMGGGSSPAPAATTAPQAASSAANPGANPAAMPATDPQAPQVDPFAQRLQEHEASQRQQWQEQVNQWRKEVTEDPHIGGASLPTTIARAQLALDRFDDGKRIGQLLEQTGYGNNPDVLRFFNRLADALVEDGLVQGQAGGSMPPLEERMYAGWSSRNGRV